MLTAPDPHRTKRSCVIIRITFLAEAFHTVTSFFVDGDLPGCSELSFEICVAESVGEKLVLGCGTKHEESSDHRAYDVVACVVKILLFDVIFGKQV